MDRYIGFPYPHFFLLIALLLLLIFPLLIILLAGSVTIAFSRLGIPVAIAYLLFWISFLGSSINLPVKRWQTEITEIREINFFGIRYRIPFHGERESILAINLGGAVIPICVSAYELLRLSNDVHLLMKAIVAVVILTFICKAFSKPVRGLGIAIPAFIPPLFSALIALVIARENPVVVAYLAGTLGTLIGADLMNLHKIRDLGAPVASIGGAGTFDGIFLSGIIAVLLV
ncbi:MAG: DUF1614 domain-containing protein [Thermoplasmata archaeon]|nr:DUF1614 domain-containing protein [Thermoplasmata archaeon]